MAVAQEVACQVEQIIDHGERVSTVILQLERLVPQLRPDQFLHLALDPYDPTGFWPESRVFSIASLSSRRDRFRISYSVRGRFTARMSDKLVEGRTVWVKMPHSRFVVDSATHVALFAGGTGTAAFTAFLERLEPCFHQPITLAYGARARELLIYRELVQVCVRRVPRLDVSYFAEGSVETDQAAPESREREHADRVSVAAGWQRTERPLDAACYLSGPPIMLKVLSQDLRARGVRAQSINTGVWE